MGGNCDNKEGILRYEHPFPRVLGYKRGSDIKKGDITKVRCILRILYWTDTLKLIMYIIKELWAIQKYLWVNIDLIIGIYKSIEIIHKPQTLGNRVVHMLMS